MLGDKNDDTYPFERKCTQFCIKEKFNGKTEINLIRWKGISCECVNGSVADNFNESGVKYCMLGKRQLLLSLLPLYFIVRNRKSELS